MLNVSFTGGTRFPLKDMWRRGQLPTVKKGLYGDRLTQQNVSIEHAIPQSKGGGDELENTALASKRNNNGRNDDDINTILTEESAEEYLNQFTDVKVADKFDGNKYIEMFKGTLRFLGLNID